MHDNNCARISNDKILTINCGGYRLVEACGFFDGAALSCYHGLANIENFRRSFTLWYGLLHGTLMDCAVKLLLVGLMINTPDFAFGIALLAVLMVLKGQHEIRRLFRQFPSQTTKQRYLDSLFILVFSLFIIAFIDLGTSLNQQHQLGILIFVIFVIQFNDIGQYLMGRLLGQRLFKRKLAPIISPNKTIEGALFGCMLTSALSLVSTRPFPIATSKHEAKAHQYPYLYG